MCVCGQHLPCSLTTRYVLNSFPRPRLHQARRVATKRTMCAARKTQIFGSGQHLKRTRTCVTGPVETEAAYAAAGTHHNT
ncbi:hypothetical protein E2C01_052960 [Portunus trituberculatus]|uniref:Uncharacterized protein n=1 Tax=Portunus trituberculatus TaxID=210409 RepID=A0A5B7GNU4_PORTR|nr:hypothetical protein [Portunus trituberculatus]